MRRLLLGVIMVLGLAGGAGAKTLTLHPHWHVLEQIGDAVGDDRYVVTTPYLVEGTPAVATVLDDQTGRRWRVSVGGCRLDTVGGGWLALGCGSASHTTLELIDLASGARRALTPPSGFADSLDAVGQHWLDWGWDGTGHLVQSVLSGRTMVLSQVVAGGRTVEDLARPSATAPLCSPLVVPKQPDRYTDGPGSITTAGRLAFLDSSDATQTASVERCGSSRPIGTLRAVWPPLTGTGVVIGRDSNGGQFHGAFLPSLTPFTFPLTEAVAPVAEDTAGGVLFLTPHHLFAAAWEYEDCGKEDHSVTVCPSGPGYLTEAPVPVQPREPAPHRRYT